MNNTATNTAPCLLYTSYSIREGMKTAEQRMKELQKLMEHGRNYQTYKPIDVYKRQTNKL